MCHMKNFHKLENLGLECMCFAFVKSVAHIAEKKMRWVVRLGSFLYLINYLVQFF